VQQVALWCVCLCVFAACRNVRSRFGELSLQDVALWCVCVCVLRVGHFGAGFGGCVCAAGVFVVCVCLIACFCVCVIVCAACGTVWSRFG